MRRPLSQIALLGSYLPRQCGIATFTADVARTLSDLDPDLTIDSIAMSDRDDYTYPDRVCLQIADSDPGSYPLAADFLNRRGYDVLSVQHEYGIFGGEAGSNLLSLVREVKMPIVTTLHTVLRDPSESQKAVMDELLQLSERVVVMSRRAVGILAEVHGICSDKIDLIPHGIPEIPESAGTALREKLGIEGPMILTFGLLSPDKGLQYVIEAMPKIVAELPGATYVVVGATHPHVRASSGEVYRESLMALATDLGVESNVRFVDRFVPTDELVEYLSAMDVYVTPYLNPKQITSGTLAYSVGAGKAVISTPYTYAEELLADGRGMLVPFRDAGGLADAVLSIQSDPDARQEMGRRAAEFGKHMLWPEVGKSYVKSFSRARRDSGERLRLLVQEPLSALSLPEALPEMRLGHLDDLTDDTGIFQHATFSVPNRTEGYCVDDNARALLLTAYLESEGPLSPHLASLQIRYLSFVQHAHNPINGRFRNFMGYSREWLESAGSEDSHGRSLWGLGATIGRCRDESRRDAARCAFDKGVPAIVETSSPRTWAYGVLATDELLRAHPGDRSVQMLRRVLAERIWDRYKLSRSDDWPWFEQSLTYANARLPQALILAGEALDNQEMARAGVESLVWLMKMQTGSIGVFAPIGTNGFCVRGGVRAAFDQQPLEAWCSVSACLTAHRVTGSAVWLDEACRAFRWFLGENVLAEPLCDQTDGSCRDGLHEDRVNGNQGAESTLSYLCALTELRGVLSPAPALVARRGDHGDK